MPMFAVHIARAVEGDADVARVLLEVGHGLDAVLLGDVAVHQHVIVLEAALRRIGPEQRAEILQGMPLERPGAAIGGGEFHVGGNAHGNLAVGDQLGVGKTARAGLVGHRGTRIGLGDRLIQAGADGRPQAARARPGERQLIGLRLRRTAKHNGKCRGDCRVLHQIHRSSSLVHAVFGFCTFGFVFGVSSDLNVLPRTIFLSNLQQEALDLHRAPAIRRRTPCTRQPPQASRRRDHPIPPR